MEPRNHGWGVQIFIRNLGVLFGALAIICGVPAFSAENCTAKCRKNLRKGSGYMEVTLTGHGSDRIQAWSELNYQCGQLILGSAASLFSSASVNASTLECRNGGEMVTQASQTSGEAGLSPRGALSLLSTQWCQAGQKRIEEELELELEVPALRKLASTVYDSLDDRDLYSLRPGARSDLNPEQAEPEFLQAGNKVVSRLVDEGKLVGFRMNASPVPRFVREKDGARHTILFQKPYLTVGRRPLSEAPREILSSLGFRNWVSLYQCDLNLTSGSACQRKVSFERVDSTGKLVSSTISLEEMAWEISRQACPRSAVAGANASTITPLVHGGNGIKAIPSDGDQGPANASERGVSSTLLAD